MLAPGPGASRLPFSQFFPHFLQTAGLGSSAHLSTRCNPPLAVTIAAESTSCFHSQQYALGRASQFLHPRFTCTTSPPCSRAAPHCCSEWGWIWHCEWLGVLGAAQPLGMGRSSAPLAIPVLVRNYTQGPGYINRGIWLRLPGCVHDNAIFPNRVPGRLREEKQSGKSYSAHAERVSLLLDAPSSRAGACCTPCWVLAMLCADPKCGAITKNKQ